MTNEPPRRHLIIAANREPFSHVRLADGTTVVTHSGSGLVAASEPLIRHLGGVWIAHGSGDADAWMVDAADSLMVPPDDPSYRLRRLWLTREEERGYYLGFANEGLWPLCHRVHVRPVFRSADFDAYWRVNERFARAVVDEAGDESLILVQDYHLALAPMLIRQQLPSAAVAAFWHIPWPDVDRAATCPWIVYLLEGLLGSTLIGFQTAADCRHFLDSAEALLGATVDRGRGIASWCGRETCVRAYPVSVAFDGRTAGETANFGEAGRSVRARYGLRSDDRLIVGIDRMEYTKGLEEKIAAIEQLFAAHPAFVESVVYLQIAEPSRTDLGPYRGLAERVRAAARAVNVRFGTESWNPVVLIETHHEASDVLRLLRAADVCYVGSLHDGMNLVAKEFVSARADERGVLVLSRFTGAAHELQDALLINPYDVEQTANALAEALLMPIAEQASRLRTMRSRVSDWDCLRWGIELLSDTSRLAEPGERRPFSTAADGQEFALDLERAAP